MAVILVAVYSRLMRLLVQCVCQYTGSFPISISFSQEAEPSMADKFDPYREALVVETATVWPADTEIEPRERVQLEVLLHAHPEEAAHLEYLRMHTGFCRQIVVTDEDLQRVAAIK